MQRALLLEDDPKLASELELFFSNRGLRAEAVPDGGVFFRQLSLATYNIYILDVNVPVMNGLDVCKQVRKTDTVTPILMLTAYGAVDDKVKALSAGADDYLVKPFHLEELFARVQALLRRSSSTKTEEKAQYIIDDLIIDTTTAKVSRAGKEIVLTPKEYKLLELLASANGETVSKQTISNKVWDIHFETGTNTIEVYINYLRKKIDKGFEKALIQTRPGFGYFLK